MKCLECGNTMVSARENYRYTESGLPYIVLVGVEVRRCPACGEEGVVIPRIEALHRAIALYVSGKPGRISPEEIRYLRTYLGWSGALFAERMGVAAESVSRWEHGTQKMAHATEKVLRSLAALQVFSESARPGPVTGDERTFLAQHVRAVLEGTAPKRTATKKTRLLATPRPEAWALAEQAA
ncbi:MAG: YgiT-type zinc finger protein [bacterium]